MWGQWFVRDEADPELGVLLNIDEDRPNAGTVHVSIRNAKGSVAGYGAVTFSGDAVGSQGQFTANQQSISPALQPGTTVPAVQLRIARIKPALVLRCNSGEGPARDVALRRLDQSRPSRPDKTFRTWQEFKRWAGRHSATSPWPIFRGQSRANWTLRATLFRYGRRDLVRYVITDVPRLGNVAAGITGRLFDITNPTQYGSLLYLAQHHGFPTPFLDWTESPYIAAFFAFADVDPEETRGNVRLFAFQAGRWLERVPNVPHIVSVGPYLNVHTFTPIENTRALPQQSVVLATNLAELEPWIREMERMHGKLLSRFDMPRSLRNEALDELAYMGISAASMFPDLDGACKALREKYFRLRPISSEGRPAFATAPQALETTKSADGAPDSIEGGPLNTP
jgi:FRG domain